MNFIRNIFGEKETEVTPGIWNTLNSEAQLDELINKSHQVPVAIFKHSTRCSISFMAKSRLERSWDIDDESVQLYFLDLIAFRAVSNKIAEVLNVQHESPQIILLKEGVAVYNTSHSDISTEGIKENL